MPAAPSRFTPARSKTTASSSTLTSSSTTHPSLVPRHPGRWARANAGKPTTRTGPLAPRGLMPGGLVRVRLGEQVALVGENVISVMQGQPPRVAAGNVGHQRAGTHPEDRARIVQRSHDGADAVPVSRCHQFGGLSAGEPAHRHRRTGRDDGIDVDHRIELDLRAHFDAGTVEHHGAGRDPRAALDHAASEVSVRANEYPVTDAGCLAWYAPDDRVLHDPAVPPDLHPAAL